MGERLEHAVNSCKAKMEKTKRPRGKFGSRVMNRRIFIFGAGGIVAGPSSISFAQSSRRPAWEKIPSIVILSPENDERLPAVREAVAFWNAEFSRLGSPFRFGKITHIAETVSFDDLRPFSNQNNDELRRLFNKHSGTFDLPERFRKFDGDVIVALADGEFKSFTIKARFPRRNLVAISHLTSLTLPNLASNAIAHEFGHVVGLDHNNDEKALMCGGSRAWWCWLKFPRDGIFPLTSDDKAKLIEMYPPDWRPSPPFRGKGDLPG